MARREVPPETARDVSRLTFRAVVDKAAARAIIGACGRANLRSGRRASPIIEPHARLHPSPAWSPKMRATHAGGNEVADHEVSDTGDISNEL